MRKLLFALTVLALLLAMTMVMPAPVAAQQEDSATAGPPPVLQIWREDVKPGKGPAHQKSEAAWAAAYKKANLKYYFVTATALSGPTEAWFFIPYGSLEEAETATAALAANKAVQAELDRLGATDGELLNHARSAFAFYNSELSYRPNFNIGDYKYIMVDTIRVKPGHFEKLAEFWKAVNAAHEKANMDEHMLVYNVGLGAPMGTVLVFQPYKSLKEVDEGAKIHGKGSAYQEAFGDEGRKLGAEFARNDRDFYQRDLLAISPSMSFVSEKVVAANPSFWAPKTTVAKAPAAKGTTPAAKKEPAKTEKK